MRSTNRNPDLYANDLRHQYVSAIYARNMGEKRAKQLGDLREIINCSGSGTDDTKIDKINNEIGREYAKKYPTIPRAQLLRILFNDWEKNVEYRNKKLNKS